MPEHVGKAGKPVHEVGDNDCGCDGSEILPQRPVRQEDNAAVGACVRLQVPSQPQEDERPTAARGLVADEDHTGAGTSWHPRGGKNSRLSHSLALVASVLPAHKLQCGDGPLESRNTAQEISNSSAKIHYFSLLHP